MMTEIILMLAALFLALFCLAYSVRRRREIYFPLPKGLPAWLKSRRAIYLAMLAVLALSAAASLAGALALLAVIAMNAALILNLSNAQSEEIGNTQLDVIRSDLQETITEAQTELLRVELDGRPSMIFSSETSNNWYLILSVDTSALYGESYRQMAMMASVNLLMLAAVAVYALLSARKAKQAEDVVSETRHGLDGFSGKLRESAAHLMRLGDARLFHEDGDPKALIGQVHDSGQRLSAIAGDLSAWSDVLGEGAPQARERGTAQSLEAPAARCATASSFPWSYRSSSCSRSASASPPTGALPA